MLNIRQLNFQRCLKERERERDLGILLISGYAVSYNNVLVTNQCCHILLESRHSDIPFDVSFSAGSVVISLQKEHESCQRCTCIIFFSWKCIEAVTA